MKNYNRFRTRGLHPSSGEAPDYERGEGRGREGQEYAKDHGVINGVPRFRLKRHWTAVTLLLLFLSLSLLTLTWLLSTSSPTTLSLLSLPAVSIQELSSPTELRDLWYMVGDKGQRRRNEKFLCIGWMPVSCEQISADRPHRVAMGRPKTSQGLPRDCTHAVSRALAGYCEFQSQQDGTIYRYLLDDGCRQKGLEGRFRCQDLLYILAEEDMYTPVETLEDLRALVQSPDIECVGWRGTVNCEANGDRDASKDLACHQVTRAWSSGFCEFRNKTSDHRFRAFSRGCDSVEGEVRCDSLVSLLDEAAYEVVNSASELQRLWPNLQCRGWRATMDCDPDGPRVLSRDLGCSDVIATSKDIAGYCEYTNLQNNRLVKALIPEITGCESTVGEYTCRDLLEVLGRDAVVWQDLEQVPAAFDWGSLQCIGWRGLDSCDPDKGRHVLSGNRGCGTFIRGDQWGYCEYLDVKSDKRVRIHANTCDRPRSLFRCHNLGGLQLREPVLITTRDQLETLQKRHSIECVGYRAQEIGSKNRGLLTSRQDRLCNESFSFMAGGSCEFYDTQQAVRYHVPVAGTRWRHPLRCNETLQWFQRNFSLLVNWEEMVSFLEQSQWECLGWRPTASCDPMGKRLLESDRDCTYLVPQADSGFCEYRDKASGEHFALMLKDCRTFIAPFGCKAVPDIVQFQRELDGHVQRLQQQLPPVKSFKALYREQKGRSSRGIVICVHDKIWIEAYSLLKLLQQTGCKLPVELWYRQGEMETDSVPLKILTSSFNVTLRQAHLSPALQTGFMIKPYAVIHSRFDQVLLLDADNYPLRDPTYLFHTSQYKKHGAIFWPDFWHVQHSLFARLDSASLFWDALNLSTSNSGYEQESGQLVIDRRRNAGPLGVLAFFVEHYDAVLKLFLWGDKDLFRFAWMKWGQSFYMISKPAGTAGRVVSRVKGAGSESYYCGMTMVQHDPYGEIIFLHRNMAKLSRQEGRTYIWEYLQQHTGEGMMMVENYPAGSSCYRIQGSVKVQSFRNHSSPAMTIERYLLEWTREGYSLLVRQAPNLGPSLQEVNFIGSDDLPAAEYPVLKRPDQINSDVNDVVDRGYKLMQRSRVIIGTVIRRDTAFRFKHTLPHIASLGRLFRNVTIVTVTQDGADPELQVLEQWRKKANDDFQDMKHYVSVPQADGSISIGCSAAASNTLFLRDYLLTKVRGLFTTAGNLSFSREDEGEASFLILLESDLHLGWDTDGVAHSFGLRSRTAFSSPMPYSLLAKKFISWDVSCANPITKSNPMSFADVETFESKLIRDSRGRSVLHYTFVDRDDLPLSVSSCYGGLSIYSSAAVKQDCHYGVAREGKDVAAEQCESAGIRAFHKCLERQGMQLILNPKQVVHHNDNE